MSSSLETEDTNYTTYEAVDGVSRENNSMRSSLDDNDLVDLDTQEHSRDPQPHQQNPNSNTNNLQGAWAAGPPQSSNKRQKTNGGVKLEVEPQHIVMKSENSTFGNSSNKSPTATLPCDSTNRDSEWDLIKKQLKLDNKECPNSKPKRDEELDKLHAEDRKRRKRLKDLKKHGDCQERNRLITDLINASERRKTLVVAPQRENFENGRIDLHGLTTSEARAVVKAFLEFHIKAKKRKKVHIITGKGNHPNNEKRSNSPKIRPKVEDLLYELNLQWDYGQEGGRQNPGLLCVKFF
jgi:DNA-nicking Smr family endonuclease